MSEIINFEQKKTGNTIEALKQTFESLTGENERYNEALKRQNDKVYDLSCRMMDLCDVYLNSEDAESKELKWVIDDHIGGEYTVGTKVIRQFDVNILISAVYGSNVINAVTVCDDGIGAEDICEDLRKSLEKWNYEYKGLEK